MSNILSHYESIKELLNNEMCKPRFADLHTSNKCNQFCNGCAYSEKLNNKTISYRNHKKILDDLIDLGVEGFDFAGGGDPLLIPKITDLWHYLHKRKKHFGIITNGTLMKDIIADTALKYSTYIRISLEASSVDDYIKYKNVKENSWYSVLSNIQELITKRNETNSKCEISVKYAIGKSLRGQKHIDNGILLGMQLGVDSIQFKDLRHDPEELSLQDKLVENNYLKSKNNSKLKFWIVPVNDNKIPQCWLNPLHLVVDYLGNVYLCCFYYYRNESHKLGNMLETPIKDLWYSKKHKELIKNIDKTQCQKVDCKFFKHHEIVEKAFKNGAVEFL